MSEFDGVLDLTGADTSASGVFDAVPSGKYPCRVRDAEWRYTKGGPNAKLPANTPYLNVQYQVDENEEARKLPDGSEIKVAKRVFFDTFMVPPADYDADKAAKLKGSMVNFLKAVGYAENEINSKKFKIDLEDLIGRELSVVVRRSFDKDADDWVNNVQGVKPAGATSAQAGMLI